MESGQLFSANSPTIEDIPQTDPLTTVNSHTVVWIKKKKGDQGWEIQLSR